MEPVTKVGSAEHMIFGDDDALDCVLHQLSTDDLFGFSLTCTGFHRGVRRLLGGRGTRTRISAIARKRPADWREAVVAMGGTRALVSAAAGGGDVFTLDWLMAHAEAHGTATTSIWSAEAERAAVAQGRTSVLQWARQHELLTKSLDDIIAPLHRFVSMCLYAARERQDEDTNPDDVQDGFDMGIELVRHISVVDAINLNHGIREGVDAALAEEGAEGAVAEPAIAEPAIEEPADPAAEALRQLVLDFIGTAGEVVLAGVSRAAIIHRASNDETSEEAVRAVLELLENEGEVYTTIDDDTYKRTGMGPAGDPMPSLPAGWVPDPQLESLLLHLIQERSFPSYEGEGVTIDELIWTVHNDEYSEQHVRNCVCQSQRHECARPPQMVAGCTALRSRVAFGVADH